MFTKDFLDKTIDSIRFIDCSEVEKMVDIIALTREIGGRLFIIGSGGGAGHASHAVCDFRKLCNIEAYSPYDNVSELTARANDDGFDTTIVNWLKVSVFNDKDCLMVISVGGGTDKISQNIVKAVQLADIVGTKIIGIVGKDGGITKELADATILIQTKEFVTPITEALQAIIWHLLVSHPKLLKNKPKW
jgi:D-sedoheptulose 7-phosphate isomerase